MAGISFTIGTDDLSPRLARLAATAKHPEKILLAGANVLKSITESDFGLQGPYRPAPWPMKRNGKPATLIKTGKLRQSFQVNVSGNTAVLSNPVVYAPIHQFGSYPVPARPYVPVLDGQLTSAAETVIAAAMKSALERELGAS